MKNIHSFLAFVLFALLSQQIAAQFTLQATDVNPTVGYGFRNINSSIIVESNNTITGANVTWNFTTLNNIFSDSTLVVAPSATPFATSFPLANIAFSSIPNEENTNFGFYSADANSLIYHGNTYEDQGENFTLLYSTPITYWTYPLNYNDQSTGEFNGSNGLPGGLTQYQFGNVQRIVDGYGTLKLPFGDYNETMRVKVTIETLDSTETSPGQFTTTKLVNQFYSYLRAGTYSPLLIQTESAVTEVNGLPTPPQIFKSINYLAQTSIFVLGNEQLKPTTFQLFPNPASQFIHIKKTLALSADASFQIVDLSGRIIETGSLNQLNVENVQTINIQNLNAGIYFVNLLDKGIVTSQKLIKQ